MKPLFPPVILTVLLTGSGAGLAAFAMAQLDAFEGLYAFTREHENWELDELLLAVSVGLVFASIAAAVHLFRALVRSRAEVARLSMTVSRLEARLQAPSIARVEPPRHANSMGRS